jgi:predicted AAA+ superfamily ATPase
MVFKGFEYCYGGEYLIEKDISVIKEMLREYITFGGFPEVVLAETSKEELVQTLFVDIVSRDILPKLKRKREIVEEIAYFLLLER